MKILAKLGHLRGLAASVAVALCLMACGGDKPEAMLASARDYLAKNDPKAAVIQLKNALQKNPELAEARMLLGQALLLTGDPKSAETELRKALALKQAPDIVLPRIAEALLAQRQFKKLTDEFSATDIGDPAVRADLKVSLAVAHFGQGHGDLAAAALKSALEAAPGFEPAMLLKARVSVGQRDFDSARGLVDSILAKSPGSHQALLLMGDIALYGKGDVAAALAAYRKSVAAKADYAEGQSAILTTLLRDGKLEEAGKQLDIVKKQFPGSFEARYFEALLTYQRGDYKRARELAQEVLKMAPENPAVLELAGAVELQDRSLLLAEKYLSKVVAIAPEVTTARRLLTSVYLRSGQSDKALATLQPLLKGEQTSAAVHAFAGEAYLQAGDIAKAEEYFSKAASQDPEDARFRTGLALTRMAAGKDDAAIGELQLIAESDKGTIADMALISALLRRKEFDKALSAIGVLEKKQPDQPLASNLRGRTLLAKQDLAGARQSFERSLAITPLYFPSVASLAAIDIREDKPDAARKRFEAVLEKDAKNLQALLALVEHKAKSTGQKKDVAELLDRAIVLNPTEKSPRLILIELYLRSKDFKQAVSVAQSAVSAIPESPELLDALGRAQQADGDFNQALATFNRVASMQPASPLPQLRLAAAFAAAKKPDLAAASLRKALDIKPDLKDAERGLLVLAMDAKRYDEAVLIARSIQKQRPKEPDGYKFEGDIAASERVRTIDELGNILRVVVGCTIFGLHEPTGSGEAEDVQVVFDAATEEPAVSIKTVGVKA